MVDGRSDALPNGRSRLTMSGARRARWARAILASFVICGIPADVRAHAIHSTLTELSLRADGQLVVRVRTFADDFSTAVARFAHVRARPDFSVAETDAAKYLHATLSLRLKNGARVPLKFQSLRRTGDVVWVELTAPAGTLSGATVHNAMLFDVHRDQVNVVKATYATTNFTTLFSRGDGPKALP